MNAYSHAHAHLLFRIFRRRHDLPPLPQRPPALRSDGPLAQPQRTLSLHKACAPHAKRRSERAKEVVADGTVDERAGEADATACV